MSRYIPPLSPLSNHSPSPLDFMGQFTVPLSSFTKEGTFTQWFSLIGKKKGDAVNGEIQLEFTIAPVVKEGGGGGGVGTASGGLEKKKAPSSGWLRRKSSSKSEGLGASQKKSSSKSKSDLAAAVAAATPAPPPHPLFGVELDSIAKRFPNTKMPTAIKEAMDYIRKVGLKEEGIFRIGGVKTGIAQLRNSIDYGACPNYSEVNNVHNVTGLVKMFLRELPSPLLTYTLYDRWIAVAGV
jgi:hypothetical protein